MKGVTVRSAAKLNLALDITGLTENGYHRMDMVMQSVDLYETVTLYPSGGISVRLPGSRVPANMHNTACKAAVAFFSRQGF